QTVTVTLNEVNPGLSVNGTFDGSHYQDWISGVASFDFFDAFCVDPYERIDYNETLVYQIQDPSSLNNYESISRLIGGYLGSSRSNEDAAAVQWAIWELVVDGNTDP